MEEGRGQQSAGGRMQVRELGSLRAAGRCAWAKWLVPAMALPAITAAAVRPAAAASARLTLSPSAVSFPPADPDAVPSIAGSGPVSVQVKVGGGPSISSQLSCQASGDLQSGPAIIPISRITWTAQGQGFLSGTLSRSAPQLVGQWMGNVDTQGQLQFWLQNSWSYAVGSYSQSVLYTLIAY